MKYCFLLICGFLLYIPVQSKAQFSTIEKDMGRITLEEVSPLIAELDKSGQYLRSGEVNARLNAVLDAVVPVQKVKLLKKKLTGPQLYRQLSRSTLLLITTSLRASAYVIDESGIIVTNYHVLQRFGDTTTKRKEPLLVMTADRHFYPVTEIIAASKSNDIAILKVGMLKEKLVPLAFDATAEVGSDVFVLGNPAHMLYYFTKGIVALNFIRDPAHPKRGEEFRMAITADYSVGESGGPVVNEFGNLVGMVSTASTLFGDPDEKKIPQMVIKSAIPVIAVKQLIR